MAELGPDCSSATLPTFSEVATTMKRVRRQQQPPLPQTLAEINLPEDIASLSGSQFVTWDPASKIMMFFSENMTNLIESK